jgi:hypothetical protein
MHNSIARQSWIVLVLCLAMGAVSPAQAQLSGLDVRLTAGMIFPSGTFADYFEPGPSVGLTFVRPAGDRAGLMFELAFERLGREQHTYVPYTNLWRYQVGGEVDVIGGAADVLSVRPYARVGATTFRSDYFKVVGRVEGWESLPERFSHTYLSGTGGLRLVVRPGDGLTWFLNGEYSWSPVAEADAEVLRTVSLEPLDTFGAATTMALTMGLSFRTR